MSNANKALLGFVIGAVILGAIGLLLAPQLLAIAGVVIGHSIIPTVGVNGIILHAPPVFSAGVTAVVFGNLQAGIAVVAGLIGGLAGGLMGVKTSKVENNSTFRRTSSSSFAPINSEKATGYAPLLDVGGQDIEKSFVKNYEQEKLANSQTPPSQWLH